jgi:hypothetical protein
MLTKDDFKLNNNLGDGKLLKNGNKILPYSNLLCLGSLLNTDIYTFNYVNDNCDSKDKTISNSKFKTKDIVKLIKYLCQTFPNYSPEYFIYYLYSKFGLNDSSIFNSILQKLKILLTNPNSNSKLQKTTGSIKPNEIFASKLISQKNINNNFNISNINCSIKSTSSSQSNLNNLTTNNKTNNMSTTNNTRKYNFHKSN